MKNRITLLNALSNILLQIFTIISAFIIPKIILSYFGSEVNGLVSSLNQLLNYIALLEGGLNSVIMASLYNISQDILAIYDKIDQQEGEIFPEDEQALMITKKNLKKNLLDIMVISVNLILILMLVKKKKHVLKLFVNLMKDV